MFDPKSIAFDGTQEEYEAFLEEEIAAGNITEEVADAMFAAFSQSTPAVEKINFNSDVSEEEEVADLQSFVNNLPKEMSFLEKVQQQENIAMTAAANGGESVPHEVVRNRALLGRDYPVSGMTDDALTADGKEDALAELARRNKYADQSFIESLSNPYAYQRAAGSVGRAAVQFGNLPQNLGGLALLGAEKISGDDLGSKEVLEQAAERQRSGERAFGTTPAMTPTESFIESLTGALVPGGPFIKALGVGTDFAIDQGIRELTDEKGEEYETVFDSLGITDNNQDPILGTLSAIGVGMLAGTLTASAVAKLSNAKVTAPKVTPVRKIDPTGPDNLSSVEKASDLTKANVVDEQQALKDIIHRNGIANKEDIDARIEFDTHAASKTRIQEAINTGKLKTRDATFKAPTPPKVLYDAYNTLPAPKRKQVARYLNLKDLRDDVSIAIGKGLADPNELFLIDQQLQSIVKNLPEAEEFSKRYNGITSALRDFGEGSLFSSKYRQQLDQTRSNYVSLELSDVDHSAPFLQRMKQAQNEGKLGKSNDEWFLQNRNSAGSYDLERRADPMNMLMQSVEATLTARMKNDTKTAIIDSLLDSEIGSQTMRKATADEANQFSDRVIQIYRNGEKEKYITSKLTAQLMHLDPYIAKYPALFVPKRIFETTAVGPLSITFAPVTAIRDAIGGRVTRPDGLLAGNPIDVAAAIPKQLWAKTQLSVSNYLQQSFAKGSLPIPETIMDAKSQKKLADNIANSYARTLYHQANTQGGFDASLMKNKIELGQGALSEVKRSIDEKMLDITFPGAAFTGRRISNMIDGFQSIFNAIQDAPRFAAIEKTMKAGGKLEDSVEGAKLLTGDVTKSGRVYRSNGQRIDVDATDQGVLNFLNKGIGGATEVLRESTPFLNPMIQGNRQLIQSIVNNPIEFNKRAWLNIGLPSLAAFGWNEMLGQEYNDYAMQRRSARDVVMNTYIGIPGRPPEEGIEIPMMHELLAFSAPYTRGLYGLARGEESVKTQASLGIVAETILTNSLDVGYPIAGQALANMSGMAAPDSLTSPTKGVYKINENDLGVLPQNIEHLARTLFASVGDTAIHTINAMAGDMSFETFSDTIYDKTMSRTPIVKNVTGRKTANVHFSIPSAVEENRQENVMKAIELFNVFIDDKGRNHGLPKLGRSDYYNSKGMEQEDLDQDMPFLRMGEDPRNLQNPLIIEFGEIISNTMSIRGGHMGAVVNRYRAYSKLNSALRKYNQGSVQELSDWQKALQDADTTLARFPALQSIVETHLLLGKNRTKGAKDPIIQSKEVADIAKAYGYDVTVRKQAKDFLKQVGEQQEIVELQRFLETNNVSLLDFKGRTHAINLIEEKRSDLLYQQSQIYDKAEQILTERLQGNGALGPKQRFDVTKHLDPNDPNPLNIQPQ